MAVDKATLGERLLMVRLRRNWSTASVAAGADISEARLYRIERGDVWPDRELLAKLCQALGVDDAVMLDEGDGWYARLKGIGAVSGPHAFDLPEQFDPALSLPNQVIPPPGLRDLDVLAEKPGPKPKARRPASPIRRLPPPVELPAPKHLVQMCDICGKRPRWEPYWICYACGMEEA